MNDATILCEYLSNMVGGQDKNRFKCWNLKTNYYYQSGKVQSINSKCSYVKFKGKGPK